MATPPIERDKFGSPVYSRAFFQEVAFGKVPGYSFVSNVGRGNDFTTKRLLWTEDALYTFIDVEKQLTISSDNANDTSAGTGGQLVLISYLDDEFTELTEIVTMNGTTPVTTVATDIFRINQLLVIASGTGNKNAGSIYIGEGTVTAGKPATVYNKIDPDISISRVAVLSVPKDKTYVLINNFFNSDSNKEVEYSFESAILGGGNNTFINTGEFVTTTGINYFNLRGFISAPPKSELILNVSAAQASSAFFFSSFLTIDNTIVDV